MIDQRLRALLAEEWTDKSERDILFPWVVRLCEPGETGRTLALLPDETRSRFLTWLGEFSPDAELIDRLDYFENESDLAARFDALQEEQLGRHRNR
jgi:hypothetical protein